MDDIATLTRQLADIQDKLIALPPDAFAERYALEKQRDALRAKAAEFHENQDDHRSDQELLDELAARRSQLKAIEGQKIDMVVQSGGGTGSGSGADGYGGVGINQGIAAAQGLGQIQARIGVLKSALEARGVPIPKAD